MATKKPPRFAPTSSPECKFASDSRCRGYNRNHLSGGQRRNATALATPAAEFSNYVRVTDLAARE